MRIKAILIALAATIMFTNVQAKETACTMDNLEFYIPEEWEEVELDERKDGSVYAKYETENEQVIEFETVPYEGNTKEITNEMFDAKREEIRTWDGYYEISAEEERLNKIKAHTTTFYIGEEIGFLESFNTGTSILNVWTVQPESVDYEESKKVLEVMTKPKRKVPEKKQSYEIKKEDLIEATIRSRISGNYKDTDVKSIVINKDLGTDAPDDYVAIVKLKWNTKNTEKTTKDMLRMYSDDLAATIAEDQIAVQEIAVFWEVPYLNKNYKWSYERKGNAMYLSDSAE